VSIIIPKSEISLHGTSNGYPSEAKLFTFINIHCNLLIEHHEYIKLGLYALKNEENMRIYMHTF
jgi:hypothetical protein